MKRFFPLRSNSDKGPLLATLVPGGGIVVVVVLVVVVVVVVVVGVVDGGNVVFLNISSKKHTS